MPTSVILPSETAKRASEERVAAGAVDVAAMLSSIGAAGSRSAVARPMPSVPRRGGCAPRQDGHGVRGTREGARRRGQRPHGGGGEGGGEGGGGGGRRAAAVKEKAAASVELSAMGSDSGPTFAALGSTEEGEDGCDGHVAAGEENSESESMGARPAVKVKAKDKVKAKVGGQGKGLGQGGRVGLTRSRSVSRRHDGEESHAHGEQHGDHASRSTARGRRSSDAHGGPHGAERRRDAPASASISEGRVVRRLVHAVEVGGGEVREVGRRFDVGASPREQRGDPKGNPRRRNVAGRRPPARRRPATRTTTATINSGASTWVPPPGERAIRG